jgi:hypothetical protein
MTEKKERRKRERERRAKSKKPTQSNTAEQSGVSDESPSRGCKCVATCVFCALCSHITPFFVRVSVKRIFAPPTDQVLPGAHCSWKLAPPTLVNVLPSTKSGD